MKTVIGVIGEKGSGKETFANLLDECLSERFTIAHTRSSDILAETLNLWRLPSTRHNLQRMAIIMDEEFGIGTLTGAVRNRILSLTSEIIIFDGVRWQSDRDMIRSFEKNILVYITADINSRYQRTKSRKEKVGEEFTSYEKFLEEEKVATEVEIPKIGETADFKIENNGTLEEFRKKVEIFCQEHF